MWNEFPLDNRLCDLPICALGLSHNCNYNQIRLNQSYLVNDSQKAHKYKDHLCLDGAHFDNSVYLRSDDSWSGAK